MRISIAPRRWDRRQESARPGRRAAGWSVDVMVTDLPEREARSALLTDFERYVRNQARCLRTRPASMAH